MPTAKTLTPRPINLLAALLVLLWLVVGGVGGQSLGKLSSLQKNDSASFLPASAESTQVADQVARFSESTSLPLIVVAAAPQQLTAGQIAAVQQFAAGLPALDVEGRPLSDYLLTPQAIAIPSQDGKAAMVILPLANDQIAGNHDGKSPVNAIVAAVHTAVTEQLVPTGLDAHVTGPAGFVADLVTAFSGIDGILLVVALVAVLVILLVVYRSPVLPLVVLLNAVLGLAAAGFAVYQVADRGWITVSGQSQGILSILVVGAATDYALLLVSRHKEELHEHESPWQALKAAWRATVEPILASAGTVALGLLALSLAELKGTAGLGPIGALGIMGALLAVLTFMPAALLLGRRWLFWPAIPRFGHQQSIDTLSHKLGWGWVTKAVGRHPRRIWIVTTVALLIAAAFLPTLRANGTSQSDYFLRSVESTIGQRVLAEHFEAGSGSPVQILVPQAKTDQVLSVLAADPGVTNPFVGASRGAPASVVDGQVLVQATLTDPADSAAALETVLRLRTDLHAIDPGVLVGGQAAQALDTRSAADRDLAVVAPAIIGIVFVILAILLRSLMAALMLVAVNVLSFAATMGVAAIVFNHVFKFPGADPTTVLYGFVFLVALGVDYSIFLMTRAREEASQLGTREGMLTALRVTGGVITSAGVVLAATFSALAVVPLLFLAEIAFIVAFGVLLDTLVVRSLLVPALTLELGRWTWWPSALWRHESTSTKSDEEGPANDQ